MRPRSAVSRTSFIDSESGFRRRPDIQSHKDFFPGAFTYHWHNFWDAPEHKDSYFGFFNEEFDRILEDKLGIQASGTPAQKLQC
jgi:hypothetical protein